MSKPFFPGLTLTKSVGTTAITAALPINAESLMFTSPSSNAAIIYYRLGGSVADATDTPILPNSQTVISKGPTGQIALYSPTASQTLLITIGEGL